MSKTLEDLRLELGLDVVKEISLGDGAIASLHRNGVIHLSQADHNGEVYEEFYLSILEVQQIVSLLPSPTTPTAQKEAGEPESERTQEDKQ